MEKSPTKSAVILIMVRQNRPLNGALGNLSKSGPGILANRARYFGFMQNVQGGKGYLKHQ
jgi:hypothetical protein